MADVEVNFERTSETEDADRPISRAADAGLNAACLILAGLVAAVALSSGDDDVVPPSRPAGPVLVAANGPMRFALAGDDLYWTTGAAVFRASAAGPVLVDRLPGRPAAQFGAVTDRFVVINDAAAGTQIRRMPGSGGPAATVAASPGRAGGDLLTDGRLLYWTVASDVRSVPVTGGPVRTLATGATAGGLGMDGGRI